MVEIHNGQTKGSRGEQSVCADAVMLVYVGEATTAVIGATTTTTTLPEQEYAWEFTPDGDGTPATLVPPTAAIDGTALDADSRAAATISTFPACDGRVDNRDNSAHKRFKPLSGE